MSFIKNNMMALVAIVIAISSILFSFGGENFGATGTRFPNGLSTNSTSPAVGELQTTTLEVDSTTSLEGDATLGGGSGGLVITTTNTATSSSYVGCYQTTATSTASPMRLVISSYATTTATFGEGTAAYQVVAVPLACP